MPARSAYGKKIRAAFTAPQGYDMYVADFNMFELAMMANFCRDPRMCAALADPKGDLHQTTADLVGVSRSVAKTLNFGLLYGMGPNKLRDSLAMNGVVVSPEEAKRYRNGFFNAYPGINVHKNVLVEFHKRHGFLPYLSGRRRRVPNHLSEDKALAAMAERGILNSEIQGSCADFVKQAMLRVDSDPVLSDMGFKMVVQVHDELVGYAPRQKVAKAKAFREKLMARLKHVMCENVSNPIFDLAVPIRVGCGCGKNWAEAK